MSFAAPVQTVERIEIHAFSDIFQTDAFQHAGSPERWCRDRLCRSCIGRDRSSCLYCGVLFRLTIGGFTLALKQCLLCNAPYKRRAFFLRIGKMVNYIQSLEGIARVKDTRIVGNGRSIVRLLIDKEDAPTKRTINSRPTNDHREMQTALVQFLHA